ncbi:hypothetical protein MRB53_022564 [Persea americana]|uniref:Uncharacterized protein n=1 Tax=Persea americana TaxID=3435 RepID=A0ACC2L7R8_PERAE|nr:hypothetical protein MRB53_022564 [Persea americana]
MQHSQIRILHFCGLKLIRTEERQAELLHKEFVTLWALDEDLGGAWEIGAIVWFLDLFDYYVNNDDQEVFSKELQLDAKVFYFDIGENKRGRFLKALEGPTRRRVTPEDEDDDFNMEYRPSRSEEELSSSGEDDLEDEFANMVGQGRQRHRSAVSQVQRAASQHTVPEHAVSQSTVPERAASQSTVPERAASQSTEISVRARAVTDPDLSIAHSTDSSVASTSRRVRGKVVGSAAEKRMKALGVKLIVPLGEMSGAFEGVNASTFVVELGSHLRRIAPYDKPTWLCEGRELLDRILSRLVLDFIVLAAGS